MLKVIYILQLCIIITTISSLRAKLPLKKKKKNEKMESIP